MNSNKCKNNDIEIDQSKEESVNRQDNRSKAQCMENNCGNICGIDSSLLFFFLILVCVVGNSDCDISMDTLLWFFLLLVVLWNKFGC